MKTRRLSVLSLTVILTLVLAAVLESGVGASRIHEVGRRSVVARDAAFFSSQAEAFSCSDVTEISQPECEALVALYDSTDGPNWTDNTGWLQTNTPCSWYGVQCTEGSVGWLNLGLNRLNGTIPPELTGLSNLRGLALPVNQLTGGIPAELGSLSSLQQLSLGGNQLGGGLPPELSSLSNLMGMSVYSNQLTGGIPPELGEMVRLETLDLHSNQLSGNIPSELGNLANLRYLNLGTNQLSGGIPLQLTNLHNLEQLALYGNQLTGGIPRELADLTNLRHLMLGGNDLTGGIPPELADLDNLEALALYSNQLSGSIPPALGSLTSLHSLYLYDNQLTGGIPSDLGNLANLENLDLWNNQLSGSIPSELGALAALRNLLLFNNQLSGGIPPELGSLASLEDFRVNSNPLTGALPLSLMNLTSLYTFDFHNTDLCEPEDEAFQAWLDSIPQLLSTGVICGSDTTPPTVVSTEPQDGQSGVSISNVIRATFSEPMDESTINTSSFQLDGGAVDGTVVYEADSHTAYFLPFFDLEYSHEYVATLSADITDEAGNPVAEPYGWTFTTEVVPDSQSWVEVKSPVGSYIISDTEVMSEYGGIPADFTFTGQLKLWDEGLDVRHLQVALNANPATQLRGTRESPAGLPGHETEVFGDRTEDGLDRFQSLHGIEETDDEDNAIVGGATREELNKLLEILKHRPAKHVPDGWVLRRELDGEDNPIERSLNGDGIRWFNKVVDVTDGSTGWIEREYLYGIGHGQKTRMILPTLVQELEDLYKFEQFQFKLDDISDLLKEGYDQSDLHWDYALRPEAVTTGNQYLQLLLKHEGHLDARSLADGGFGSEYENTRSALIEFQEEEEIHPAEGDLTDQTLQRLNTLLDERYRYDVSRTAAIIDSVENSYSDLSFGQIPIGVILGMAAAETGGESYDNELVAPNPWGRGIMQIDTPDWYVGYGSGAIRLVEDASAVYPFDLASRCRNAAAKCRYYYTNSPQGIEANIRDSLGVLQHKYTADREVDAVSFTIDAERYTIAENEMLQIIAVAAYSGGPSCLKHYWDACEEEGTDLVEFKACLKDHCSPGEDYYAGPPFYVERVGERMKVLTGTVSFGDQAESYLDNRLAEKLIYANSDWEVVQLFSPGTLEVSDAEGRVTGWADGRLKEEIPNSFYDESVDVAAIFFPESALRYKVRGTDSGQYGLMISSRGRGEIGPGAGSPGEDEASTVFVANVPISSDEVHQYIVNWDALSQGDEGVTVQVDSDGDGVFEKSITTDSSLTRDEFILKTETVIDIDPDVLHLESEGTWVTAYIEFPEGYDVGDIDVGTARLEDTVPAELHPSEVGDYDEDGTTDLMVKFDRRALIEYLDGAAGEVALSVSGELTDGTPFGGSDTVRVIELTE